MIVFLVKILARLYLFFFLGVARVILRGERHFFSAFKRALNGDCRCILAFRHPNGGEPQLLAWFIILKLRHLAARAGFSFALKPHVYFVYGYEVARWGGAVARLVMPRLGAMPVHHSKMDRQGMMRIYEAIMRGPYPLAIAPEGQVSYTTEDIPRLEQGPIRIGFQAASRMVKAGKDCPVEVLPVSFHYRYGLWGKITLEMLIKKIERYTRVRRGKENASAPFTERLERCRDHILGVNEGRYGISLDRDCSFPERADRIIDAALECTERILGVKSGETDVFSRLYFLRQLCWDRIFLPGQESLKEMSGVERAAADLRAGEAWHAGRHLELVDFIWYFRVPLPSEADSMHVKIEYVQNLWDFANRTMGGAYSNRTNIFPRRVIIQAAPALNLTERLPDYHRDKKGAILKAMSDLKDAYLDCIQEVNKNDNKRNGT
ncbi:MAG: acyltransferase [Treponema sp.]|jgi:1-acyl-sn-glycerol-3-phosphate acyltransferase|nr:acyltransferase [Treponema sp.]